MEKHLVEDYIAANIYQGLLFENILIKIFNFHGFKAESDKKKDNGYMISVFNKKGLFGEDYSIKSTFYEARDIRFMKQEIFVISQSTELDHHFLSL